MAFDFTGSVVPVLSAGAVRRGLLACAEAYTAYYGAQVEARFATAPEVGEAMAAGKTGAAVVIAPYAAFLDFARNGWVNRGQQHGVGVVRAGIVVRSGAPMPDLRSVDGLRAALERADAVGVAAHPRVEIIVERSPGRRTLAQTGGPSFELFGVLGGARRSRGATGWARCRCGASPGCSSCG